MNTICGVTFIRNNTKYDYHVKESIESLLPVCHHIICVYVEGEDDTLETLKSIESDKLQIIELPASEWDVIQGKERLSYITNIGIQAADRLGFTYVLYCQADEIIDQRSYDAIRKAVNDNKEAYMCRRVNLWKTPYFELNVGLDKMPCSNHVIRLAKVRYRAVDDAEQIKLWHLGFVRKKEVMKSKIINMQENVFGVQHDIKLDTEEHFNPDLWFNPETDLKPISERLPSVIQEWVDERWQ